MRTEKKSSPLLWIAIVVVGGLALWLWLDRQPGAEPSQTITGTARDEPSVIQSAPGDWKPLLIDKPELIERLKITGAATPGWKLMQSGFAPVLEAKNVALRLKARSHSLRIVSRWSETADNGTHGLTLRIGPDSDGKTRLFGGWIKTVGTNKDGVIEPQMYNSSGPSTFRPYPLFEAPEGQEYEIELRSFENRLEVLVDGKMMKDVRDISLPGHVIALHPRDPFEFKDLEWRQLTPDPAPIAETPNPKIPASSSTTMNSATSSSVAPEPSIVLSDL